MTRILFIEANGTERPVDAAPGLTVMEAAIWNDVPGIEATCGGPISCGTCLVHLAEGSLGAVPPASGAETALLEDHEDARCHSRLSCQLKFTAGMPPLVLNLPEAQR